MPKKETLYKTTHADGRSWHGNAVYAVGKTLRRGRSGDVRLCTDTALHACRIPEQAGVWARGHWPFKLWKVEGVVVAEQSDKVGCKQLHVVEEVPLDVIFGPNGKDVLKVVERAATITYDEATKLRRARDAARDAAWGAAWDAARDAAWGAARDAAWGAARDAARDAAWDAALATVVADLVGQHGLTQEHVDKLRGPWKEVIGETWNE